MFGVTVSLFWEYESGGSWAEPDLDRKGVMETDLIASTRSLILEPLLSTSELCQALSLHAILGPEIGRWRFECCMNFWIWPKQHRILNPCAARPGARGKTRKSQRQRCRIHLISLYGWSVLCVETNAPDTRFLPPAGTYSSASSLKLISRRHGEFLLRNHSRTSNKREINPQDQQFNRLSKYRQTWTVLLTIFLTSCTFIFGSLLGWFLFIQDKPTLLGVCSNSPQKAREAGCVFDPMMYNWVNERCYWKQLSDEYLAAGNWTFYRDAKGQLPYADEDVRRGDVITAWVTADFHHSHCAFILEKRMLLQAGTSNALDSKSRSSAHSKHCLGWLSKPKPEVFDLVALNFSRESLGCISGGPNFDCYSKTGTEVCWPGERHSILHHSIH
ncbi:uncharacterized protein MYCFIDRAFT_174245 [Pseudocercospora fijiensis CIRAD86]|uniref:Uncharacterized protein n=1 Tax=Pseudocercospora fijiensis (strain CIRAD86) TaxID=383855 RepID=M2ZUK9_PSEFD|nr:uncharacterized protein MYCFIDRAFT_174245 [Pseudocercospora fijiensis CIRAD86]EME82689.1 hypothetical protein MYCFIDRAFT_174245 [Pseudocercospora fijiensis CIRAD86]